MHCTGPAARPMVRACHTERRTAPCRCACRSRAASRRVAPGGEPTSLDTLWRSMYSLMSRRIIESRLPKYCSASTLTSSVLPTPAHTYTHTHARARGCYSREGDEGALMRQAHMRAAPSRTHACMHAWTRSLVACTCVQGWYRRGWPPQYICMHARMHVFGHITYKQHAIVLDWLRRHGSSAHAACAQQQQHWLADLWAPQRAATRSGGAGP